MLEPFKPTGLGEISTDVQTGKLKPDNVSRVTQEVRQRQSAIIDGLAGEIRKDFGSSTPIEYQYIGGNREVIVAYPTGVEGPSYYMGSYPSNPKLEKQVKKVFQIFPNSRVTYDPNTDVFTVTESIGATQVPQNETSRLIKEIGLSSRSQARIYKKHLIKGSELL